MKSILETAKNLIKHYKNDPSAADLVANAERIVSEKELTANQATVLNSIKKELLDNNYFADSIKDVAAREGMKISTVRRVFGELRGMDLICLRCELRGFWSLS